MDHHFGLPALLQVDSSLSTAPGMVTPGQTSLVGDVMAQQVVKCASPLSELASLITMGAEGDAPQSRHAREVTATASQGGSEEWQPLACSVMPNGSSQQA